MAGSSECDFQHLSLYEVLQVNEHATKDEIKKAYHCQSLKHHPDRNLRDAGATSRFTRVLEAYETLSDDRKRAEYDQLRVKATQREAFPDPPAQHGPSEPPATTYTGDSDGGISASDIADFLQFTSGQGFDIRNDHDEQVGPELVAGFISTGLALTPSKQGLFRRMHDFFLCLALDERRWGSTKEFPTFGCAHSVWSRKDWIWDPEFAQFLSSANTLHEVDAFYSVWSRFETAKTFEWEAPYDANYVTTNYEQRMNRDAQAAARQRYNTIIRMMVAIVMKADPRHAIHLIRVQEKRRYDDLEQKRDASGNTTSKHSGKRSKKMTGNRKTRKRK
ncbi:hypothetical protein DXG03_002713 [Asterophora parasitica]|uniref:J domain-containing protein n=1 Tax=Asterophora parasitica TaxID=117018 RepID=A0A9P7G237_9AGAR|nr:hypothetical protein DXG03_002713 [Asterophora parasitica]